MLKPMLQPRAVTVIQLSMNRKALLFIDIANHCSRLTVCVRGRWVGQDSLSKRKNSKPEKGSKTRRVPASQVHVAHAAERQSCKGCVRRFLIFSQFSTQIYE